MCRPSRGSPHRERIGEISAGSGLFSTGILDSRGDHCSDASALKKVNGPMSPVVRVECRYTIPHLVNADPLPSPLKVAPCLAITSILV